MAYGNLFQPGRHFILNPYNNRDMRIVFIGSGNVATHLSLALQRSGYNIVQIYSRTIGNARCLAEKINAESEGACSATDNINDICTTADAYIFSVKDDALKETASAIGRLTAAANASPVFIHTAGSVPLTVFEGIVAHAGVLYPMQTFSKAREVDFSRVPCFVEATDDATLAMVRELACSVSESVAEVCSEKRKMLHLAAVFACNFANHCYTLAEDIVQEAGVDFSLFLPLIEETARKVSEMSPRDAQTGPMVRGDETVMNAQKKLITNPNALEVYEAMARSIKSHK